MKKKKKLLILGGEGFIGRNLCDFFYKYYDCYSLDIRKSLFEKRKDKFIKKNIYQEFVNNDFDYIIHLIDNPIAISNFEKKEINLIKNIKLNPNNHLIVFSSAVVYANPNSDYGKRKLVLEKIYTDYCQKNSIPLTIIRLFNIYGPYQIPNKQGSLVANIICNHLNEARTEINDLDARRDFFFSQDLGKFIYNIIKNKITGTIDLGTNHLTSIRKLISLLEKSIIKKKLKIVDKKKKETLKCPLARNILLKKIKTTPMEVGLTKTSNFYKNNLKITNKLSN